MSIKNVKSSVMKFMKVYNTSAMTEEMWETIRSWDCFVEDGYAEYTIGYFHDEAMKFSVEEPEHAELYLKQAAEDKKVDDWFIANAAEPQETVLVYHG